MSYLEELKRRKVIRLAIIYLVGGFVALEVASVLQPALNLPGWVVRLVSLLLILGFPMALIMAWHFEWTDEGLKRTAARAASSDDDDVLAGPGGTAVLAPAPSSASVAVLPFVNMSGDVENEYFSDGLSEELLNVLAKIGSLKVAARTSSFHFKGQTGDIADIAKQLGVASILEGSVRKSGVKVRITAQLINAADGYHLWSETFDRELTDIFAVQDEIASSVAEALKVTLLAGDVARLNAGGTDNAEAFQAYLQGVHHSNRGSDKEALSNAVERFEKAIELDPDYALAYAKLAESLEDMVTNGFLDLDEIIKRVAGTAKRAIELAPDLAEGYQIQARVLFFYERDFPGAVAAIEKAVALNPGSAGVQTEYSRISALQRKFDTSIAAASKAIELDPVSMAALHWLGQSYYEAQRYDEAKKIYRRALKLNPHHPRPHYGIGICDYLQGNFDEAAKMMAQEPLGWMRYSGLAIVCDKLGQRDEAEKAMASLIEGWPDNGAYQHGQVYAQWGDFDSAFASLHRACDLRDPGVSQVLIDPLIDVLRDDSRFEGLMEEVGYRDL